MTLYFYYFYPAKFYKSLRNDSLVFLLNNWLHSFIYSFVRSFIYLFIHSVSQSFSQSINQSVSEASLAYRSASSYTSWCILGRSSFLLRSSYRTVDHSNNTTIAVDSWRYRLRVDRRRSSCQRSSPVHGRREVRASAAECHGTSAAEGNTDRIASHPPLSNHPHLNHQYYHTVVDFQEASTYEASNVLTQLFELIMLCSILFSKLTAAASNIFIGCWTYW